MGHYDTLIPIGQTCNISFLLQNLKIKKETSLFEWFASENLKNITNILKQIEDKTDENIVIPCSVGICMFDESVNTSHYKHTEFQQIYIRRRERLLDNLRKSVNILFVRFEYKNIVYEKKDIDDFVSCVRKINPSCKDVKLLLISPNNTIISHPCLFSVFYDKHLSDTYCKTEEINTLFKNALKTVGYDIEKKCYMKFNDRSVV